MPFNFLFFIIKIVFCIFESKLFYKSYAFKKRISVITTLDSKENLNYVKNEFNSYTYFVFESIHVREQKVRVEMRDVNARCMTR